MSSISRWLVVAACACKTDVSTPPGVGSTAMVPDADLRPFPAPPTESSTSLRVRVSTADSKPGEHGAIARCRPSEQLTGGGCVPHAGGMPRAYIVSPDGRTLANDGHTFGAGYFCASNATLNDGGVSMTAQALCVADPSRPAN